MTLQQHLLSQNLITGPLPDSYNTSHSSMSAAKNFLLGLPQFAGDEKYLVFGNVLHEHLQRIEDANFRHEKFSLLSDDEKVWLLGCLESARKNLVVQKLIANSRREEKLYCQINGCRVAFIIDVDRSDIATIVDWKSTSCTSEQSFIDKAINDYDYLRQGELYKQAKNLKHCYFIGLQKRPPHNVYIMDVSRFKKEIEYSKDELNFLLYFYKHYGKMVLPGIKQTIKIEHMATTKGKEAIKVIAASHKEVTSSAKAHGKLVARHQKLVAEFPAKEKDAFAEKLTQYSTVVPA